MLKKIQILLVIVISLCIPMVSAHLYSDDLVESDFFSSNLSLENVNMYDRLVTTFFKGSSHFFSQEPSFDLRPPVLRC